MELTEFEEKVLGAIAACRDYDDFYEEQFIKTLHEIMPPTCTATERKFLDEIREKGKYRENIGCVYIPGTASELYERDFKIVLKELVNG